MDVDAADGLRQLRSKAPTELHAYFTSFEELYERKY
jgi:hypothetical protein